MTIATHPQDTDLLVPLPAQGEANPYTVHTHYFGASVPQAGLELLICHRRRVGLAGIGTVS